MLTAAHCFHLQSLSTLKKEWSIKNLNNATFKQAELITEIRPMQSAPISNLISVDVITRTANQHWRRPVK